jgi:glycosyltransferase involved in cell wall biosynthesis
MKTVLLVCNEVPHYRVSVYNYLHSRFLEHGWHFTVASNAIQGDSTPRVSFDFREIEFTLVKYQHLVNEIKPDVVILHLHLKLRFFWLLIHWLKLRRIPIVSWTKGANLDKPYSIMRYALFNYAHSLSDALLLYSNRQIGRITPNNRHKIFAANNTVNFQDYPEVTESKAQIKAELGLHFDKLVLFAGTMGVDGERKHVDHLIHVFATLARDDIGLVLVGKGLSDERKAKLNSRNTRYLGPVHDSANLQISKLFKAADILIVPGHVGLALNQAFYWGVPVITECGRQPPEIQYLKPGRNGFIVRKHDLAALKEKMLYLLDNDAVRAEFARHAREDIMKEASIENMFLGFHSATEFAARRNAEIKALSRDMKS